MIEHVHLRLLRWADWAAGGRRVAGLGYAVCSLARWEVRGSVKSADPRIDSEASDTDRAVTLLPAEVKAVVVEYYLRPGTARQKARACGLAPKAFYERLHHAHHRVRDMLEEGDLRSVRRVFAG